MQSSAAPSDRALVLAARSGEDWACEALFRRHMQLAVGLSQRMLADRHAAADVAQDAMIEAFTRLDRLDNPQAFAAWLGTIVVHRAHKHLRQRRVLHRLGLSSSSLGSSSLGSSNLRNSGLHDSGRGGSAGGGLDAFTSPAAPADAALELRAVAAALAELPADERMALLLRRVEGLELREIARRLRLSLATIKRRINAAEAAFQRAFGET